MVTADHQLRLQVFERRKHGDRFSVAAPSLTEVLYGISLLPRAQANLTEWARVKSSFNYYTIDTVVAEEAAALQVKLRRQGWQLGTVDALIAAVALRYDLILLTTDKDFRGIGDLKQENWLIK